MAVKYANQLHHKSARILADDLYIPTQSYIWHRASTARQAIRIDGSNAVRPLVCDEDGIISSALLAGDRKLAVAIGRPLQ